KAERDAAPVIGAPAKHAGPPPGEARPLRACERLSRQVPSADAGIELAEGTFRGGSAALARLIGPAQHGAVGGGVVPPPSRFEHDDSRAAEGEAMGSHPAARTGPDDAYVVFTL